MHKMGTFFNEFFMKSQINERVNLQLLFTTIIVLLVALFVCVIISRRNNLYIKPKRQEQEIHIIKENEVA